MSGQIVTDELDQQRATHSASRALSSEVHVCGNWKPVMQEVASTQ